MMYLTTHHYQSFLLVSAFLVLFKKLLVPRHEDILQKLFVCLSQAGLSLLQLKFSTIHLPVQGVQVALSQVVTAWELVLYSEP